MAIRRNITAADEWHQYEKKRFRVTVIDTNEAAYDLAGIDLEWMLYKDELGPTPALDRQPNEFLAPEGAPITNIAVWEVTSAESGSIAAGDYSYELWDRDNDALLVYGSAVLLPGHASS